MTRSSTAHPVAVLRLLRTVVAGLHQSARAIESGSGVTNAQLFLLRQIAAEDRVSVTELAARIEARQNTVSAVLRRLIASGLVRKNASPHDARRAELSLTPEGRQLLRRAPAPPTEDLLHALKQMSARDRRALSGGLSALVTSLGLDPEGAPLLFEPIPSRTSRASRPRS